MPPSLATIVYLAPVIWLFRRDFRERPNVTSALWLPFFWIFISGTRFISEWLGMIGLSLGGASAEEGSPVDALFFFILIAAGVRVLFQRRVSLAYFTQQNRWITIYLVYCLIAISWSDFPFVGLKRWIKLFGQPVMALIVLTEPDPMESFARLMKRLAYIIVPVSILFIKYFPQWSTVYDNWNGGRMNTGIATNKNILGCDCFILALFFVWHFQRMWKKDKSKNRRNEIILCVLFLMMLGWVLNIAHSSTSIGSLIIAIIIMWFMSLKFLDRRRIGVYLVIIATILILAEVFFGIHDAAITALGRNSTLTGRTEIWHVLLNWDINPILGTGFESFWLGDRANEMSEMFFGASLNEAHNGYLETYLNLGLLGVFITIVLLFATYLKIQRSLAFDFDFCRFRLAYLIAFIVYNWTEAAFRTHCVPFFMFFLIACEYSVKPLEHAATLNFNSQPKEMRMNVS